MVTLPVWLSAPYDAPSKPQVKFGAGGEAITSNVAAGDELFTPIYRLVEFTLRIESPDASCTSSALAELVRLANVAEPFIVVLPPVVLVVGGVPTVPQE